MKDWIKRNKKLLIILAICGVIGAVLFYFLILAGNAESNVEKSQVEKGNLEAVSGTFVTTGNKEKQEIFFVAEGPKTAEGYFKKFNVEFSIDGSLESAQVVVSIKAGSIFTDNGTRDGHLKGEDFFNVDKHPNIVFTSSSIEKKGDGFIAKGTLEFLGAQKDFEFPFSYRGSGQSDGKTFHSFEGKFGFKQFAMGMPEDGSIGDVTEIKFYVDLFESDGSEPVQNEEDEEDDWEEDEPVEMELNQEYDDVLNQIEEEAEMLK